MKTNINISKTHPTCKPLLKQHMFLNCPGVCGLFAWAGAPCGTLSLSVLSLDAAGPPHGTLWYAFSPFSLLLLQGRLTAPCGTLSLSVLSLAAAGPPHGTLRHTFSPFSLSLLQGRLTALCGTHSLRSPSCCCRAASRHPAVTTWPTLASERKGEC